MPSSYFITEKITQKHSPCSSRSETFLVLPFPPRSNLSSRLMETEHMLPFCNFLKLSCIILTIKIIPPKLYVWCILYTGWLRKERVSIRTKIQNLAFLK